MAYVGNGRYECDRCGKRISGTGIQLCKSCNEILEKQIKEEREAAKQSNTCDGCGRLNLFDATCMNTNKKVYRDGKCLVDSCDQKTDAGTWIPM